MTKYAQFWNEAKYAVLLIGIMAVFVGALAYSPETKDADWGGFAVAIGVGILLGWPAGGVRFSFRRNSAIVWTAVDLAVRVGIVFAIEMLMRQFEARYGFKARIAVVTLIACYFLYPPMSISATTVEIYRKLTLTACSIIGGIGLLLIAAAFSLKGMLISPLPELIGALGLGLVFGPLSDWIDHLVKHERIWLTIVTLLVGAAAALVVVWILTAWWWGICGLVLYVVTAVASAYYADRNFR